MSKPPRYYRKTMIEEVGNQIVDVTIMELVRFHAATEKDRNDLLQLLSEDIGQRHLELILPRWGTCQPLQAQYIDISRNGDRDWNQKPTLTATLTLEEKGLQWAGGELFDVNHGLADILAESFIGQPLAKLATHPYLPRNMTITNIERLGTGWLARFNQP